MSEYAERFAENGIDISVLHHLTDQDLKDIGVLLGHRRKMLAAIGELTGAVPAAPQPFAGTEPKTDATAAAQAQELAVDPARTGRRAARWSRKTRLVRLVLGFPG
jgi:uncharacterized protein YjiS (DUF1127 family)